MNKPTGTIDLTDSNLPRCLRCLREERHLSQSDLAAKAGLSYRTVHDLETGRRDRVLEKTVMLLATALDVTVEDLLGNGVPVEIAPVGPRALISWRRIFTAVAIVIVVAAVTVFGAYRYGTAHAVWDVDGAHLTVRDGVFGMVLWERDKSCRRIACADAPWSDDELLVAWDHCDAEISVLTCVERATGRELWTFHPDERALLDAFGEDIMLAGSMNWRSMRPCDLDADGEPEILVEFIHSLYYPDVLCRVDRHGRLLNQYASKGHISDLAIFDLDNDGKEEIVAAGVNNSAMYQGATVFVLDDAHFGGATVDSVANPETVVRDSCLVRIVLPCFPEPYMAMMEDVRLGAGELTVFVGPDGGKRLSVEVGASQNFEDRLVVFFDSDLEVLRVGIKDKFLENIGQSWPDSLKRGTGPGDGVWREGWVARRVRFGGT